MIETHTNRDRGSAKNRGNYQHSQRNMRFILFCNHYTEVHRKMERNVTKAFFDPRQMRDEIICVINNTMKLYTSELD
jgi:hypothetical protein